MRQRVRTPGSPTAAIRSPGRVRCSTSTSPEYTHEKTVADEVNVGTEVYLIETKIFQQGGKIAAEQMVEKRERQTRAKRWERQDSEEDFTSRQLDRSIVVPDQIRTVIRAFRDKLSDIFPGRTEVPKTLIFAKTDSNADDIIQIVRNEFGESNDFCRKITHQADNPNIGELPRTRVARFAVTEAEGGSFHRARRAGCAVLFTCDGRPVAGPAPCQKQRARAVGGCGRKHP
jgi:hypothetical protein